MPCFWQNRRGRFKNNLLESLCIFGTNNFLHSFLQRIYSTTFLLIINLGWQNNPWIKFFCLFIDDYRLKVVRLVFIRYLFWNFMGKILIKFKFCRIVLVIWLLFILFLLSDWNHHRNRCHWSNDRLLLWYGWPLYKFYFTFILDRFSFFYLCYFLFLLRLYCLLNF